MIFGTLLKRAGSHLARLRSAELAKFGELPNFSALVDHSPIAGQALENAVFVTWPNSRLLGRVPPADPSRSDEKPVVPVAGFTSRWIGFVSTGRLVRAYPPPMSASEVLRSLTSAGRFASTLTMSISPQRGESPLDLSRGCPFADDWLSGALKNMKRCRRLQLRCGLHVPFWNIGAARLFGVRVSSQSISPGS